jgi:hypothetical protein
MPTFVRLRRMLASNEDLARKLTVLEKKYDSSLSRLRCDPELMAPPESKKRKIGFLVKERAARYGRG